MQCGPSSLWRGCEVRRGKTASHFAPAAEQKPERSGLSGARFYGTDAVKPETM